MGPATLSIECVAPPFKKRMAPEKLDRAALEEKTIPMTAATPHATPNICRRLRLRRLTRYLRNAFVTIFIG
jgi:hypothetical protein